MSVNKKSWQHRLSGQTDDLAVDFVESLSYDRRLYKYDIQGSIAHAQMLVQQKLLSAGEFEEIKSALAQIEKEIESGAFVFDKTQEDIHMAVEAALIAKTPAGKKLHTGRSRNDQVSTDLRLWMRDEIASLTMKLKKLQRALVDLASGYTEAGMPSYTHLQRAQPVTVASYVLAWVEQFQRDIVRLSNCCALLNICPLGSGAVAGSTLPLDRQMTSKLLGFDSSSRNSIDATADRDFCAEFIFCCSMVSTHLSRLAEDWIIYSTNEFDFIHIDDAFCTSSSMMPQKRNPDMLELIRGKTGSVYGSLVAMLTIIKGLPLSYNRDLQEDKIHVFSAADTVSACVDMAAAIAANTRFKIEHIEKGLDKGFLDATVLAEYLVRKNVPFRQAHGIVGQLVAYCENKPVASLGQLSIEEFQKFSPAITQDIYAELGAKNVISHYVTEGAGGTTQAKSQIAFWREQLK